MAKSLNNFVRNPLMMRSRAFNMGWSQKGINKTVSGRFVGFNPLPSTGLIAHFDEKSIVGDSPVTQWQNQGSGGAAFDLDTVVGTASNLTRMATGVARLTGAATDHFQTPNSVLNSVLGDIDIRWKGALDSWASGAPQNLLSKHLNIGDQRSYLLKLDATGTLTLSIYVDGITATSAVSTVIVGLADGTTNEVRAFWDSVLNQAIFEVDSGAGFVQLGAAVPLVAASIFDSTADVEIGSQNAGANSNALGYCISAQVFDGINGTLAVNFDPRDANEPQAPWTDQQTAAVWSANGDAFVNTTGKDVVNAAGLVGIETTATQLLPAITTVFAAARYTLATPIATEFISDSRDLAPRQNISRTVTDWRLNQGAPIAILDAPDVDVHVFTGQFNGDITTKFSASGLTSITGDAGATGWNFGALFMGFTNLSPMTGWISEFIVYDRALTPAEIELVQGYLGSKWL